MWWSNIAPFQFVVCRFHFSVAENVNEYNVLGAFILFQRDPPVSGCLLVVVESPPTTSTCPSASI